MHFTHPTPIHRPILTHPNGIFHPSRLLLPLSHSPLHFHYIVISFTKILFELCAFWCACISEIDLEVFIQTWVNKKEMSTHIRELLCKMNMSCVLYEYACAVRACKSIECSFNCSCTHREMEYHTNWNHLKVITSLACGWLRFMSRLNCCRTNFFLFAIVISMFTCVYWPVHT